MVPDPPNLLSLIKEFQDLRYSDYGSIVEPVKDQFREKEPNVYRRKNKGEYLRVSLLVRERKEKNNSVIRVVLSKSEYWRRFGLIVGFRGKSLL